MTPALEAFCKFFRHLLDCRHCGGNPFWLCADARPLKFAAQSPAHRASA